MKTMSKKILLFITLLIVLQGCSSYSGSVNSSPHSNDAYWEASRQARNQRYYHNKLVKGEPVYFNRY